MRSFKRMLLGAMAAMVFVAVMAAGSASAAAPAAPTGTVPSEGYFTQDANAPYLAWQGEHVRLVGCDYGHAFPAGYTASWLLVDPLNWPDFQPQVDMGSVKISGGCAIGTWISDKPGTAAIKLIVHDASRRATSTRSSSSWAG